MKAKYLRRHGWKRGEVVIWLTALVVAVVLIALSLANAVGDWVSIVPGLFAIAVVGMRYRAKIRQNNGVGSVDDC
jgi:hypothetical protein